MKTTFLILLAAFFLSFPALATCKVDTYSNVTTFHQDPYNENQAESNNQRDYGLIFDDANNPDCSLSAAFALHAKLVNTFYYRPSDAFNKFVEGTHVSLMFAAAMRISANGDLHTWLDDDLQMVRDVYQGYLTPGCGFAGSAWESGNTCMDDYSINAVGHAWVAAYENKRGRSSYPHATAAQTALDKTFDPDESICINKPGAMSVSNRGPCNSTSVTDLVSGGGQTFSLNHGTQNIAYGVGLFTLVSGALIGLEEAGIPMTLSYDQQVIAKKLVEEAQAKIVWTVNGYEFRNNSNSPSNACAKFTNVGGVVQQTNDQDCGDSVLHYKPYMFELQSFYAKHVAPGVGTFPAGGYQFSQFWPSLFSDQDGFFHLGRRSIYGEFGSYWVYPSARPDLFGVVNAHQPIGYLDSINSQGVAAGWTCDEDEPTKSIVVHFYVDGFSQFVTAADANQGSEPAVNSLCGGGWAHRFAHQLPEWTRGRQVSAYGLDSLKNGSFGVLPGWQCPQNPACTW